MAWIWPRSRPYNGRKQSVLLLWTLSMIYKWPQVVVGAASPQPVDGRQNAFGRSALRANTTEISESASSPEADVYVTLALFIPLGFLVYEGLLFVCFVRTNARYQQSEDERWRAANRCDFECHSTQSTRDDMVDCLEMSEMDLDTLETLSASSQSASTIRSSSMRFSQSTSHGAFWVDEDLVPWRLEFHDIHMIKRLSPVEDELTQQLRCETWVGSMRIPTEQSSLMVVAKWVPQHWASTDRLKADLLLTVKRHAALSHPNVVSFYGVAWSIETNYVAVMEYLCGGDLRTWLGHPGVLRRWQAQWTKHKLQILLDIGVVLASMHSTVPPLVHGKCQSSNILLTEEGRAKFGDFGLSSSFSERTCKYPIAPEASLGKNSSAVATDVYAFGMVMLEMETHDDAVFGIGGSQEAMNQASPARNLVAERSGQTEDASCPSVLHALIMKCIDPCPCRRPSIIYVLRIIESLVGQDAPTKPVLSPTNWRIDSPDGEVLIDDF